MVAAESSDRPAGDSAVADVASVTAGFASVAVADVEFSASSATTLREIPAITALQQTIENNTLRMAWPPFIAHFAIADIRQIHMQHNTLKT